MERVLRRVRYPLSPGGDALPARSPCGRVVCEGRRPDCPAGAVDDIPVEACPGRPSVTTTD